MQKQNPYTTHPTTGTAWCLISFWTRHLSTAILQLQNRYQPGPKRWEKLVSPHQLSMLLLLSWASGGIEAWRGIGLLKLVALLSEEPKLASSKAASTMTSSNCLTIGSPSAAWKVIWLSTYTHLAIVSDPPCKQNSISPTQRGLKVPVASRLYNNRHWNYYQSCSRWNDIERITFFATYSGR